MAGIRRLTRMSIAVVLMLAACATVPVAADAFVYWSNYGDGTHRVEGGPGATIGRANLDGGAVDPDFVGGANFPTDVAVDGTSLYWSNYGTFPDSSVGRSALDGSAVDQHFAGIVGAGGGVAVDAAHVYWSDAANIGRIRRDGSQPQATFIKHPAAGRICGVAVDARHVYWAWTDLSTGANIGRATLDEHGDVTLVEPFWIDVRPPRPCGVAVNATHIFWANLGNAEGTTIGRANIDGSGVDQHFVVGADVPCGVAVDAGHVYWANHGLNGSGSTIGRANLDGTGVQQDFIRGASGPCGVAVDALSAPPPVGPAAATAAATNILQTSATLRGSVNPNAAPTTYRFEWGTTSGYGNTTPVPGGDAGGGALYRDLSAALTGLTPETAYHFRIVATNANATVAGLDQRFTTLPIELPRAVTTPDLRAPEGRYAGSTLYCVNGFWTGEPTFEYVWFRDGVAIAGAGGPSATRYTTTAADANHVVWCSVVARNGGGAIAAVSKTLPITCPPTADLRCFRAVDAQVNEIEVTQGIQPSRYSDGSATRRRTYGAATGEVALRYRGRTVVRVYANLRTGPSDGIANIPVTLEALTASGRRLGPILPSSKPAVMREGSSFVGYNHRTGLLGTVHSFTLPQPWTEQGTISLIARANPALVGCVGDCPARAVFRLDGVPFRRTPTVDVVPVALTDGNISQRGVSVLPVLDPHRLFDAAVAATPMDLSVYGWHGFVDVGDLLHMVTVRRRTCFVVCGVFTTYTKDDKEFREILQGLLFDRLEDFADEHRLSNCDRVIFGVIAPAAHGQLPGATRGRFRDDDDKCPRGYAALDRPLAVAHELQHALGRNHAGQDCPGTDGAQEGEAWPPDNRGVLGGIGLDTRGGGPPDEPFPIIPPSRGGGATGPPYRELYDLMSYCWRGDASDAWISPRGWGQIIDRWGSAVAGSRALRSAAGVRAGRAAARALRSAAGARARRRAPRAAASGRTVRVTGLELASGAIAIAATSPAATLDRPAGASSPYVLEVLDDAGTVLAGAPVRIEQPSDSGARIVRGTIGVPAGAAGIRLRRGNVAVSSAVSPRAPKVRLLSPSGARAITGRALVVRWSASDPDHGAEMPLTAAVDYSVDGGRTWRVVSSGPAAGRSVALPRSALDGSDDARVRVRVDDGVSEAAVVSKRLRVASSPPRVRIAQSARTIAADSTLTLIGGASAPDGRPLQSGRLSWADGRERLGGGSPLTVSGLSPGRHRIVLRASRRGRTGSDAVTVQVRAVRPAFLRLRVPARIRPTTRALRLTVASTVGARLRVGGRRFAVSPHARTIVVAVRRGKGALRLTLLLSAGRLTTSQPIVVARG